MPILCIWHISYPDFLALRFISSAAGAIGAQHGHAFHVPRKANQRPLAAYLFQSAQRELPKAHHGLDDPEDRFDRLHSQGVRGTPGPDLQFMRHGLHWRGSRRQRRWFAVARAPARMVLISGDRDQRLNVDIVIRLDVLLAAITSVGDHALYRAQRRSLLFERVEHWPDEPSSARIPPSLAHRALQPGLQSWR